MAKVLHVGLFLSKDKKRKIKLPGGMDGVRCPPSIQLIEIDPSRPLNSQGPFDVIIQKVLEWDKDGSSPDVFAEELELFCNQNPSITLVDSVRSARILSDRSTTLTIAAECRFQLKGCNVFVPPFITYDGLSLAQAKDTLRKTGIRFPVVCKSSSGAANGNEHAMSVVFSEENLQDVTYPCVIQQFLNHGGKMHKVYVVGDKFYTCERPSIKDLKSGPMPSLHFNGNQVSKEGFSLPIHRPDVKAMRFRTCIRGELLDRDVILELIRRLRSNLNTTLFGIDLIIDHGGNYGIVDVNYFPGYSGVLKQFQRDLFEVLINIGRQKGLNAL